VKTKALIILIILILLIGGGFFVWKNVSQLKVEKPEAEKPEKEIEVPPVAEEKLKEEIPEEEEKPKIEETPKIEKLTLPETAKSHFGFVGNLGVVGLRADPLSFDWNYDIWFKPHLELGLWWDRPHPGPFSWHFIEPVKGRYDFSRPDRYVKEAQKRGVQILATIWPFVDRDQEYWRSQPGWRASKGFEMELPTSRYKPHDMQSYRRFIKALVERYDGDGIDDMPNLKYPIKHWEILNEPETGRWSELNFFSGTAKDYLEILRASYEEIKAADPDAKVLNGGIAAAPPLDEFWHEVFKDGGGEYIDILTIHRLDAHPYLAVEAAKKFLAEYGQDKPIWVTEIQVPSGFLDPLTNETISEETQAVKIVQGYVKAFSHGAEKLFYTSYKEAPSKPGEPPNPLSEASLVLATGEQKPGYLAFQTMVKKLDYFTSVKKLAENQYKFTVSNKSIYVIWGPGPLPSEISGKVKLTDLYGKETILDASQITLTDSPIFVELIK
jgi:hypothetical protein